MKAAHRYVLEFYLIYGWLELPYPFKQLFVQTAEIPGDLSRDHGVVHGFVHLPNSGYGYLTPGGVGT